MKYDIIVTIIGCGGTGSRLLSKLVNYYASQNVRCRTRLVDEDIVEKKNIERQMFTFNDIGKYKSQCLADEYNYKHSFYYNLKSYNTFVNSREQLDFLYQNNGYNYITFLCVDNLPTRKLFWEYFKGSSDATEVNYNRNNWFLIDCGNSATMGQVTTSGWWKEKLYGCDPRILYPNMQNITGSIPRSGGTCSNNHVSEPQTLFANEMTSLLAYDNFTLLIEQDKFFGTAEWANRHVVGDQVITGWDIGNLISLD